VLLLAVPTAAVLLPLAVPFVSLGTPSGETWSHLVSTVLPGYLSNTLFLALGSALLAGMVGSVAAWMVSQYDFPGRAVVQWALVLPLSLPLYVAAQAFGGLFEYDGPVNSLWIGLLDLLAVGSDGTDAGSVAASAPRYLSIRHLPGLIFVSAFALYPYVYVTVRSWLETQGARLLEAGRSMSGEGRVALRLGLPLARPALIGGMILVVMETLNEYGAPLHFGVSTLTTGIFRTWFALADIQAALRLAALLLGMVFVLLMLERLSRGGARFSGDRSAGGAAASVGRRRLRSRWGVAAALVVTALPVLIGFVAPVAQLVGWALHADAAGWWSFAAPAGRSIAIAGAAAGIIGAVALFLAHGARTLPSRLGNPIVHAATVGYAVPGAVIAVGMLQFGRVVSARLPGVLLIGSVLLLVGAYVVRFLGVAFHPTQAAFDGNGRRLRESARALGASSMGALFRGELPPMRRIIGGAAVLVFVDVLKELPLTLVLRPFDFETLATSTFRLAGDERVIEASIPALMLVAAGCVAVLVLTRVLRGRDGGRS
jgi:iron(III) transport system permease protein